MSALSHLAAHEIARDLGCLVSSQKLSPSTSFAGPVQGIRPSLLVRLGTWLRARLERRRTMAQLNRLPDYMLEDIGLNRGDIARVASDLSTRSGGNGRFAA